MKAASRISAPSGFTLLELLVSLAILAVVVTMVYASLRSSLDVMDRVDRDADLYRQARVVFSRLSEELSMAYPETRPGEPQSVFIGRDQAEMGRARDALQFASLSHIRFLPDQPESELTLLEYRVEKDPERDEWVLLREERPYLYGGPDADTGAWVIGEGIEAFNLRYYDGKVWADQWNTAEREKFPRVVEIEIRLRDREDSPRSFITWAEIPIAE